MSLPKNQFKLSNRLRRSSTPPPDVEAPPQPKRGKRQATVYDAVAGRVSIGGFIPPPSERIVAPERDTTSSSTLPAPPQDILFSRRNAPQRFEEEDVYFRQYRDHIQPFSTSNTADDGQREVEDGEVKGRLPDSDLLKGLHRYVSSFYSRSYPPKADGDVSLQQADMKSMDGTALLALGILLEEAAKIPLGRTGDLVFTEADHGDDGFSTGRSSSVITRPEARKQSGITRRGKRRKLVIETQDDGEPND